MTSSCDFDVIVVGAGPAGSMAAYHLAKKNFNVMIVDQQEFPRYKPCGGGLPERTLKEIPFDLSPVLDFSAAGGIVTYRGQPRLKVPLTGNYAWLAMRDSLDQYLFFDFFGKNLA